MTNKKFIKQVRYGMAETNSSSSHSVTWYGNTPVTSGDFTDQYLCENNTLIVCPEEYGWEWRTLSSADERLNYLIALIVDFMKVYYHYETDKITPENLYNYDDFKKVEDVIREYTEFDQVRLREDFEKYPERFRQDIGVDHQSSTDEYSNIDEFLSVWHVDLPTFLFGEVEIRTGNDNETDPEDYGDSW